MPTLVNFSFHCCNDGHFGLDRVVLLPGDGAAWQPGGPFEDGPMLGLNFTPASHPLMRLCLVHLQLVFVLFGGLPLHRMWP